ncbi:MAG: GAP family protein [Chloroflexi bacterium]|nr:GAP family protein [Chloroflexota bacterium]
MGQAIGQILPLAVGVALSPVPIIAVILMLVTADAKVNGPVFILGWLVGLGVIGTIVLLAAGSGGASSGGQPATWVSWLKLILGVLALLIALRQWRGRPQGDAAPPAPQWMGAIEKFTPVQALGVGALLSGLNPKNTLLAISAAAAIAATGISGGQQAVAYVIFMILGTVGVGAPVVIYFAMGHRAPALLDKLRQWMAQNNAVIMAVLMLVIGAKLVGDGIAGLF